MPKEKLIFFVDLDAENWRDKTEEYREDQKLKDDDRKYSECRAVKITTCYVCGTRTNYIAVGTGMGGMRISRVTCPYSHYNCPNHDEHRELCDLHAKIGGLKHRLSDQGFFSPVLTANEVSDIENEIHKLSSQFYVLEPKDNVVIKA